MRRKIVFIFLVFLGMISLVGCGIQEESDAHRFKNEYEDLNGEVRDTDGKTIRKIEIPKDNPFVYESFSSIMKRMDNKETFVLYFGFPDCPWCRSVLPSLMDVLTDLEIDTIYYVDVKDLRDTYKLDEEGNAILEKEGASDYQEMLTYLDNVLDDYVLIDKEGNSVPVLEKRIFAPNIVAVVDGKAVNLTDGISEKQTDAYMELTEEMRKESYDKIKCAIQCVVDDKKTCSVRGC